jgi:hypothetical protein
MLAIEFYGVQDYAESGSEDRPVRAWAGESRWIDDLQRDPLALLIPLAACRLLSLSRRAPQYVPPLMGAVLACGEELTSSDEALVQKFRVRKLVETDPSILADEIAVSGGAALSAAEFNSSLPLLVSEAEHDSVERSTGIWLKQAKLGGGLWAEFQFRMDSSNPLVTAAALFAAIEYVARTQDYAEVTRPAAAGLLVLGQIWKGAGSPATLPVKLSKDLDSILTGVVMDDEPLAFGQRLIERTSPQAHQ